MIEVVYSGEEHEEQDEVRIPKNIHQIGNNSSNKKIYIEDYVMTYLKKSPSGEDNVKYGVLLGDVKRAKGNVYIFVKGMVEVRDVIENSIIFNDDIWSGIYKDIKQFFEQLNIVGWYVSVPYRVTEDMNGIRKIHLDNFAGNDKVCFVKDRAENEEGFYSYEQSGLGKQQGYYIYYEKNEKMKKYVKNLKNSATNSGIANNEIKNISVDDKIGGEDKKDKKSSKNKLENIELKAEEANGKTIKISKEYSQIENKLKEIYDGNNKNELNQNEFSMLFKSSVTYLNDISNGFENAVQERMKSERMKAELITNVSHDIKTPLTSIINYVDLLKQENIQNSKAEEYIEILDNKSQRLKKLTEDLVEASKISTGNISLKLEKINVVELIKQATGEFEDKFKKHKLEVIVNSADDEINIMADSRYMYRIIENLYSNISKYALENSRVYIDVKRNGKKAFSNVQNLSIEIKNISKDRLNISAEELMQRFVRGDKSRTTEGSGLGISIAQNLTELQNGKFELTLDGDLFKVKMEFVEV